MYNIRMHVHNICACICVSCICLDVYAHTSSACCSEAFLHAIQAGSAFLASFTVQACGLDSKVECGDLFEVTSYSSLR